MIADKFAEDGFVVVEGVFPESEIRSTASSTSVSTLYETRE